ncbi:MAG TPA: RNase adapter RapZ [Bacillota bacterium]
MADRETFPISLVIITGLSGAGKTEAMRAFEDMNYFCIDNLPPALIPKVAELCRQSAAGVKRVAIVVDIRGGEFFDTVLQSFEALELQGIPYHILFLEADDATLVRRYKETRRRHPLAPEGRVTDGIARERQRLRSLRERAHRIVDTSGLDRYTLRQRLRALYGEDALTRGLRVTILSFGFKHGLPLDADFVFDLRCLPNPYYEVALRAQTGLDTPVQDYVLKWPLSHQYLDRLTDFLRFSLPLFQASGREQVVIALGCTGGRHRSVVFAEELARRLRGHFPNLQVEHRDLGRAPAEAEPDTGGPA